MPPALLWDMRLIPTLAALSVVVLTPLATSPLGAQQIPLSDRPWTGSVIVPSGGPVVPLFDGWYDNPDGSRTLCFGYYSTNSREDVSIPLGPGNRIEPEIYDGGQPDYFERIPEEPFRYRRRYCVFPVRVPASFTAADRVVWTLQRGRGEVLSVPGKLVPASRLDEPSSPGRGDVAPTVRLGTDGPAAHGRNGVTAGPLHASVGEPLALTVHVEHPEEEVWVGWAKQNGPGHVTFSEQNTLIDPGTRMAHTTASFDRAGRYLLRIQSIDDPVEAFEYHCCWTNVFVEVVVE